MPSARVAKLIHRRRHREAERKVSRMRTWLGWLARDIARKLSGEAVRVAFAMLLNRIAGLLRQPREDRGCEKIYARQPPRSDSS